MFKETPAQIYLTDEFREDARKLDEAVEEFSLKYKNDICGFYIQFMNSCWHIKPVITDTRKS